MTIVRDFALVAFLFVLFVLPLAYVCRFLYRILRGDKFKSVEAKPSSAQPAAAETVGPATRDKAKTVQSLIGLGTTAILLFYWFVGRHMIGSVDYTVSAAQLVMDFMQNEVAAHAKYEGKVVKVSGSISQTTVTMGEPWIVLGGPVSCNLRSSEMQRVGSLKGGQEIVVVGEVTGGKGFFTGGVTLMPCRIER